MTKRQRGLPGAKGPSYKIPKTLPVYPFKRHGEGARLIDRPGIGKMFIAPLLGILLLSGVMVYFWTRTEIGGIFKLGLVFFTVLIIKGIVGEKIKLAKKVLVFKELGPAELTISRWPLVPGDRFSVAFRREAKGQARFKSLKAVFSCKEWVWREGPGRSRSGRWVSKTVVKGEIPASHQPVWDGKAILGEWSAGLARSAMHSFEYGRNLVQWTVTIEQELTGAPNTMSEFKILVSPRRHV